MTPASPPSNPSAVDVIEQNQGGRGRWRWRLVLAAAVIAAVAAAGYVRLPAQQAIRAAGPLVAPVTTLAPCWQARSGQCWAREPFAGIACSLPAVGVSGNGWAEALLARQRHRYSVLVGAACR